jgi:subtilase family serine protease
VTVTNQGIGAAGAFLVAVTLRGNLSFPPLAPGASATMTFDCVANVSATADPDNRIQESNETNNSRSFASICIT